MNTLGILFNILAFVVGTTVYVLETRRLKLNSSQMTEVAMIGVLGGLVLAAVVQFLYSVATTGHMNLQELGGKTIIGGVLGGWISVELAKMRLGIQASTGPVWALALPAGEAVGRIGCWFHGCCFGKTCSLPWSVFQHGAYRHPTQFYLSFAALLTVIFVLLLRDKTEAFAVSLFCWSISRIIIEPLRDSSTQTPWLVPSACLFIAVYAFLRINRSWKLTVPRLS